MDLISELIEFVEIQILHFQFNERIDRRKGMKATRLALGIIVVILLVWIIRSFPEISGLESFYQERTASDFALSVIAMELCIIYAGFIVWLNRISEDFLFTIIFCLLAVLGTWMIVDQPVLDIPHPVIVSAISALSLFIAVIVFLGKLIQSVARR